MLLPRVLSGAVGIPLLLALVYQGGVWFSLVIAALALIGVHEFFTTLRVKDVEMIKEVAYPVVAAMVFTPHLVDASNLGLLYGGLNLLLIGGVLGFCVVTTPRTPGFPPDPKARFQSGALLNSAATVLAALYVSLFAFFILMRKLEGPPDQSIERTWEPGALLLVFTMVITWSVDSGAYFVGRSIGKTKLSPRLSPGKTIEGSLGGWACGVVAAIVLGLLLGYSPLSSMVIGAVISATGQLGDLAKSALKRDIGVKDFGNLIPGHGGVLDRFDSLLFNVPLVYLFALAAMGFRNP